MTHLPKLGGNMNFRKMSLFVVFALVAVSLGPTTHHSALSPSRANAVLADGGLPMPPPMGPSSPVPLGLALTVDGVLPMPPPVGPSSSLPLGLTLTADGGLPMPPPPPSPWGTVTVDS